LGQLVTLAPLGARQTHPLIGVNPKPPSLRADALFSRIYLLNFIHIMKRFKCQIINKLNSYITLWY